MSLFSVYFKNLFEFDFKKLALVIAVFFGFSFQVCAQYSISGKILNRRNQEPVEFAIVSVPTSGLWANANAKGEFTIKNIPTGKVKISVQYLGFVKREYEYTLDKNLTGLILLLDEDNLTLSQVEITAKKGTELATSFVLDRQALDHIQMLNVTDATALLPGGKTSGSTNIATTGAQRFQINGTTNQLGNATFGVGLEIDGVRISNNSLRDATNNSVDNPVAGPDTKNIATGNIESIEVITGIPSVEHGDMTNGMVRINTKKGVSPYQLELSTQPNNKRVALSKGISLGSDYGVLNFSVDYTKSISNIASPYTAYDRNTLSLNYNNTVNKKSGQPISLNFGITGNVGGYNSAADPDLFVNTYTKKRDNVIRANFTAKWLINSPWITNLEASGNINYNDKLSEVSRRESATASKASIRTTEEGYHVGQTYATNPNAPIVLIPNGSWYEVGYSDNKLINYNARLKGNLFRKIGRLENNFLLGGDFSVSGNNGRGSYYDDLSLAPTWREYRYDQESFTRNYAAYAENTLTIPINKSNLQLVAGLRSEVTAINGSEYGNITNWSPRANAKYTFWERSDKLVSDLNVKVGWGKTVKLPGFDALYVTPSFVDILTFSPGTTANGETFYAYYTMPRNRIFNPDLKWQSNVQQELAIGMTIAGNRIFITAAQDRTSNPYNQNTVYDRFNYKLTTQKHLESSAIPAENRIYNVDQLTGVVTVTDKTGLIATETLAYNPMYAILTSTKFGNGSPVTRKRITWTMDFKQIRSLKTTLRVDGNYNYYKGLEQTISADMSNLTQLMPNGQPSKYVGFFVGGGRTSNGSITKSLDMNLTATTHIPTIRLVVSLRLEGSFYQFSQTLSESANGKRGFVLKQREGFEPSDTETDIYGGNRFVGVYPEYYIDMDNPNIQVPFAEKFLWAKTNDPALYNELAKMVVKTNYNYTFNSSNLSNYYSANLSVTKEIGRFASLSFFANNFFNNMAKVRSTWAGTETSLFGSSYIPPFNYGATLRIKI